MRKLCFLLLVLLAGCIKPPEPVWTEVPGPDYLLSRIAAEAGRYRTLDGAAKVSLTTGDQFFSSQQFLLLEKPDHLRVDVLTGFGQLILQLTSDGDLLSVFLNNTVPGRFLQGPASDENISRFIRVPLAVDDLLALLLYDPPLIAFQQSGTEVRAGTLVLVLIGDGSHQEIVFNDQLQLIGCRYSVAGKKQLEVSYRRFVSPEGFPLDVEIEIPQEETRVKIKFSELKVNGGIDTELFRLQKPENLTVEVLP